MSTHVRMTRIESQCEECGVLSSMWRINKKHGTRVLLGLKGWGKNGEGKVLCAKCFSEYARLVHYRMAQDSRQKKHLQFLKARASR